MKFNFYLRPHTNGQSKKEPRAIYFVSYFIKNKVKQKFAYCTRFKVVESHWNDKDQRVKNVLAATDSQTINNYLNGLSTAVNKWCVECVAKNEPITIKSLKAFLEDRSRQNEVPENISLFPFIEEFIRNSPQRINPQTKNIITERTIMKYRTTLSHLKKYSSKLKTPLDFDNLDINFYNGFLSYLTNTENMMPNSIGKYIAVVKVFLSEAEQKGIAVNQAYKSRYFKVLREDVENIYLNEIELKTLENWDLSDNSRLDKVRDLFLIGAWTGLRFSDFTEVRRERIKENSKGEFNIELNQRKTGGKVNVPCNSVVLDVLRKYDFELPKPISNQKFNDYLKELCQLVGFTNRIEVMETKGGKRKTDVLEKWELIGTHTARRSFATNMYKRGVQTKSIMKITGHKTETAFHKYIVLNNDEHAEILREYLDKPEKLSLRVA